MFKQFVEDCKNIKLTKTTFKTVNQVWAAIFVTLKVSTQLQIFWNLPLSKTLINVKILLLGLFHPIKAHAGEKNPPLCQRVELETANGLQIG